MLLVPIPWTKRVWALPFLTALAPSERYCRKRRQRHKRLTDWGRQLVLQAQRWLPSRELVVVDDSIFAALEFLPAAGSPPGDLRHPLAGGCHPLRSGVATSGRHEWAAPHQRQVTGEPVRGSDGPGNTLGEHHHLGLVWRR